MAEYSLVWLSLLCRGFEPAYDRSLTVCQTGLNCLPDNASKACSQSCSPTVILKSTMSLGPVTTQEYAP
jgi:hypothetical protein